MHNIEIFDLLKAAHVLTGHGWLYKIYYNLKDKYANITRQSILLFLSVCGTCVKKRAHPKKGVVVKPILTKETYARGQVDLIDMQSSKDDDYKFICNY